MESKNEVQPYKIQALLYPYLHQMSKKSLQINSVCFCQSKNLVFLAISKMDKIIGINVDSGIIEGKG